MSVALPLRNPRAHSRPFVIDLVLILHVHISSNTEQPIVRQYYSVKATHTTNCFIVTMKQIFPVIEALLVSV